MCGVFGVRSRERDVARLAYFGLYALQHRGQESAGIAVSDRGRITTLREMGLVARVFDEEQLQALPGEVAIGHTRYSTTGAAKWENAQPVVQHGSERWIALGHNGNLTNAGALRDELASDGIHPASTSDTELIAALLARDPGLVARRRRADDGTARGRLLGRRHRRGDTDRVPRSSRHPAARDRAARRRLGNRVRDVRVRPGRCGARPRRATRRGRLGRPGRVALAPGRPRRAQTPSASSSTSTSRGRTRISPASPSMPRGSRWVGGWPARRRPRRTS